MRAENYNDHPDIQFLVRNFEMNIVFALKH